MHRERQPERLAQLAQVLDLAHPAPEVVIAQHDLHGVSGDRLGQMRERGHGHVARQGNVHAPAQQFATGRGHAVQPGGGILEIASASQLRAQALADAHRGLYRPSGIRIDAQGHVGSELRSQLQDRLDFLVRAEHAALELDVLESVFVDHRAHLRHDRGGRQALAVLVLAGVGTLAAAARVLVERVGRERHGVPAAAAEQVAHRHARAATDQVQAGGLQRGVRARPGIEGILAGRAHDVGALGPRALPVREFQEVARDAVRVRADHLGPDAAQGVGRTLAAVGLRDADDAVLALDLDDVAQRIRRVQPVRTAQGRVGDGDGVNPQILDFHGRKEPL